MDIIFQDGDFYNTSSKVWTNFIGAIIGCGSAIGVVFLRDYVDNKKENNKEKTRLKELEDYFIISLNYIIPGLIEQRHIFLQAITVLKEENFKPQFFSRISSVNTESITSISNIDLLRIFLNKNKEYQLKYNTFQSTCLVLNSVVKNIQIFSDLYNDEYDKSLTRFNIHYNNFSDAFNSFFNDVINASNNDYNSLMENWEQFNFSFQEKYNDKDIFNPYLIYENIIEPMLPLFHAYFANKKLYKIYEQGIKCNLCLLEFKKTKNIFIELFQEANYKLNTIEKTFQDIVISLKD